MNYELNYGNFDFQNFDFEYNTSFIDGVKVGEVLVKGFFDDQCISCEMSLSLTTEIDNDPNFEMLQYEFYNSIFTIDPNYEMAHFPSILGFDPTTQECNKCSGLSPEEELRNWIIETKIMCKQV